MNENDDSYWIMRDDDQIEELKTISRRIFFEASLGYIFSNIFTKWNDRHYEYHLLMNAYQLIFNRLILNQRKKKKAKFDKENERETHELKLESK